jgi:protein-tyrosine-phosphatase
MRLARVGPLSVLFACNLNRVRSPMAAALARRIGGEGLVADSCGVAAAGAADPFLAAVMLEIGLDLAAHQPKAFDAVQDRSFDLVISLTPEAHQRAQAMSLRQAGALECWPTPDPTLCTGSRESKLEAYRTLRDDLERQLAERFGPPST